MEAPKKPVQLFATAIGVFLIPLGLLALIFGSTNFGTVSGGAGQEFIIWQVSGWETILYMATGAIGLLAAARLDTARTFALVAGIGYAAMAVWGFIDGNDVIGLFAVDTTDNITYAAIGGLGLLLGAMPEAAQERSSLSADERERRRRQMRHPQTH